MVIVFKTARLQKECCDRKTGRKVHGPDRAKRVGKRLDDLRAAATLEVMRSLPGRCHELTGDRAGQLAIDLDHPYRLIFEPADNPVPRKDDGGLDWSKVTSIRILEICDYHG